MSLSHGDQMPDQSPNDSKKSPEIKDLPPKKPANDEQENVNVDDSPKGGYRIINFPFETK